MNCNVKLELGVRVKWWARIGLWVSKHLMGFCLSHGIIVDTKETK